MRAVLQRVTEATVSVAGATIGQIAGGLVVLLGAEAGDTEADLSYIVDKTVGLRIFADAAGKMNVDIREVGGAVLVVSQFTLLGDARRGRRPGFTDALEPTAARALYERASEAFRAAGLVVATGQFGADMKVALVNDGPVTILLDSRKLF